MSFSVAILGATGVVGQKAIAMLSENSNFVINELVASDQRAGMLFSESCDWREVSMPVPEAVSKIKLSNINHINSEFVISCLPSEAAELAEKALLEKGKIIFSNASNARMREDVPLMIPEINENHISLLKKQLTPGKIITNPNCSAAGVSLALAPLMQLGEIKHVSVVTMQSVSGAGYPGIPSLDILGNTIPHIPGEALKITEETKKILGAPMMPANFAVSTHVHRVPVLYGHTVTLHIRFNCKITADYAIDAYHHWNQKFPELFVIHSKDGRPQALKDLTDNDMSVHIGHIGNMDGPNVLGLVCLTHNLARGAAGAAIRNMESYCGIFK